MSEEKESLKEELSANEQDTVNSEKVNDSTQENDPIAQLEEEKKELQDKYLRLYSEFENFRRRTAKESVELRQTAAKDLIYDLLPVVDDFERGLDVIRRSEASELAEGVELIYNKLKGILERKGLKPMNSKETDFDPDLHEALTKMPAPNVSLKGKVLDEIEKGYLLHEKVLRYAKVVVAE